MSIVHNVSTDVSDGGFVSFKLWKDIVVFLRVQGTVQFSLRRKPVSSTGRAGFQVLSAQRLYRYFAAPFFTQE